MRSVMVWTRLQEQKSGNKEELMWTGDRGLFSEALQRLIIAIISNHNCPKLFASEWDLFGSGIVSGNFSVDF